MSIQIIIVSQAPLTPQIKRDTFFGEYMDRDINTKFWDISNILHPGIKYSNEIDSPQKQLLQTYKELEREIAQNITDTTIFQIDFDPSWKTNPVFRLFKKYKCKCIRVDAYANTCLHPSSSSLPTRIKKLISKNVFKLTRNKFYYLSYKLYNHYLLRFHFLESLSSSVFSSRTRKINHPDYEEFQRNKIPNSNPYPPHIIFIDTFFGFHPDMKYYHKTHWNINPDKYHQSLRNYFDYLEEKYNMPVIIAAHPKAEYSTDVFGNRPIIKYQTLQLIKSANYIIAQICNTFSWIALSGKPVMLLANNEYLKAFNTLKGLNALSKTFGCRIQNIDEIDYERTEFERIPQINRTQYIYNYLTSKETEERRNIDILIETALEITTKYN